MKCETCGQETPELPVGAIVSALDAGFMGLGVVNQYLSGSGEYYVTFFVGPYAGTRERIFHRYLKQEHGYVHINRTETDYTRHAL